MRFAAVVLASAVVVFAQASNPPSLKSIHKIYIDKMDNDLDQYIRAEVSKQLKGKLVVVVD